MKAFIILAFCCAPLIAFANHGTHAKLTAAELQTLSHIHNVNQLEVDLGKLAIKRGTPAIRVYAQMLVDDHQSSDTKIKDLVKRMNQAIPRERMTMADKKDMADTKRQASGLAKLVAGDFDREYLRMMVAGHDKELSTIDAKIAEATNADVIKLLRAKKETLQKHADGARELQKNTTAAMR
jgi:predicted outer membrane protein